MQVEMSTIQTPNHMEMREEGNDWYYYYYCCYCHCFQRIHCVPGIVLSVLHVLNHLDRPTSLTPMYCYPHPPGHKCEAFGKLHLPQSPVYIEFNENLKPRKSDAEKLLKKWQ